MEKIRNIAILTHEYINNYLFALTQIKDNVYFNVMKDNNGPKATNRKAVTPGKQSPSYQPVSNLADESQHLCNDPSAACLQ